MQTEIKWWAYSILLETQEIKIIVKRFFGPEDIIEAYENPDIVTTAGPFYANDDKDASTKAANKFLKYFKSAPEYEENTLTVEDYAAIVAGLEAFYPKFFILNNKLCAVSDFAFTSGLIYNIDFHSYQQRYCFPNKRSLSKELEVWDGKGHPGGNWIKCKGLYGDFSNPLVIDEGYIGEKIKTKKPHERFQK